MTLYLETHVIQSLWTHVISKKYKCIDNFRHMMLIIRNYAMHNPLKLDQKCFPKKGLKYLKMYFSVPKLLLILLIQHFILYLPLFMPISMMFFNDVLTSCGICMLCTTPNFSYDYIM